MTRYPVHVGSIPAYQLAEMDRINEPYRKERAMTGLMRDRELEAALLDVYDRLPGPMFLVLSEDTRTVMLRLAKDRNPNAGKGRVTNRRLDMRLKANRDVR